MSTAYRSTLLYRFIYLYTIDPQLEAHGRGLFDTLDRYFVSHQRSDVVDAISATRMIKGELDAEK